MSVSNRIFHAVTIIIDHKDVNDDQYKEMINRGVDEAIKMGRKEFGGNEFHIGVTYKHDFPYKDNTEATVYCHEEKPTASMYEETYFIEKEADDQP